MQRAMLSYKKSVAFDFRCESFVGCVYFVVGLRFFCDVLYMYNDNFIECKRSGRTGPP